MVLATDAFNANFYVVAATVTPVLFLALMLPGGILARYGQWVKDWRDRRLSSMPPPERIGSRSAHQWVTSNGYTVLYLPVYVALTFGGVGEVAAVLALDAEHATRFEHLWVRASVIGLAAITVASTLVAVSFGRRDPNRSAGG